MCRVELDARTSTRLPILLFAQTLSHRREFEAASTGRLRDLRLFPLTITPPERAVGLVLAATLN